MKRIFYSVALLTTTLVYSSCGSEEEPEEVAEVNATEDVNTTENETQFESEEESFVLPSPILVAQLFDKSGLEYDNSLPLDPGEVDIYTTMAKKEVIFGVYSADLAYSVMNEQDQASIDYLAVVEKLANETGLSEVFDSKDLVTRFEENIGNNEEIIPLLIDIQERTSTVMEENKEAHKSVIHFAGAWVEGMYLGAKARERNDNKDLGMVIGEQMVILENLIKGLNDLEEKNDVVNMMIEKFEVMHETFNNFESVKSMSDDLYHDPTLTDDELNTIGEMVIELRTELIKP